MLIVNTALILGYKLIDCYLNWSDYKRRVYYRILCADSAKSDATLNNIYDVQMAHRWYCNDIEGTRNNYQIYFNPNGSVREFNKH